MSPLAIEKKSTDRVPGLLSRKSYVRVLLGAGVHHPHNADPLPGGNVIIADSDNDRIIEVNTAGEVVWSYGDD